MSDVHPFNHAAMATHFQARIQCDDRAYAAQAAQAAFDLVDLLEAGLSRFRANSDICRLAVLEPGEKMRLNDPVFACLQLAQQMEQSTQKAFCATSAALQRQPSLPRWELLESEQSVLCVSGRLHFDLGAIGKGFALDRMAELMREWECGSYLLNAGGSSVLAGDPPADSPGWSCGLGEDDAPHRLLLSHASLSGSGLAVKGSHILDPRNGLPAERQTRAWAVADSAAESDALSTACMVLSETEIEGVLARNPAWLAYFESGDGFRRLGKRTPPDQSRATP